MYPSGRHLPASGVGVGLRGSTAHHSVLAVGGLNSLEMTSPTPCPKQIFKLLINSMTHQRAYIKTAAHKERLISGIASN